MAALHGSRRGVSKAIRIVGSGAVCAIGIGVPQVWAAVRAGISRSAGASVHDKFYEPMTMALLPEGALPPLSADVGALGLQPRANRMLWLAAPALAEAMAGVSSPTPLPLFMAVPEDAAVDRDLWLTAIGKGQGCALDVSASQLFATGRAGGFQALAAACDFLRQGGGQSAVVGAADSYLDLELLTRLDAEDRILGSRVMDGFIPGEGAAFLLLTTAGVGPDAVSNIVRGVATAEEQGHRYADAPAKGEGLSGALENMRGTMGAIFAPAQVTFAGLNGESFGAKEWGVANLRHNDLLSPDALLEHPADCFGDVGAAMGVLLVALADAALLLGHRDGPALVWASSERELRGCAWLERDHGAPR